MKPVDLIVANAFHETFEKTEMIPKEWRDQVLDGLYQQDGAAAVARYLAAQLSHEASLAVVHRMLAAAGAPHGPDEIIQRLKAVNEQRQDHASQ